MTKLIILDRDGVINFDSPNYIKSPEEWNAIPGSLLAISELNDAGYTVAIATNQSGVGRGIYNLAILKSIHQKMRDELSGFGGKIDGIFFCQHTPEANCKCRKPKPGLLLEIAENFKVDLKKTKVSAIGDSLRDLQAAQAAGCEPILVLTGNGEKTSQSLPPELHNIQIFEDLLAATRAIIIRDLNSK